MQIENSLPEVQFKIVFKDGRAGNLRNSTPKLRIFEAQPYTLFFNKQLVNTLILFYKKPVYKKLGATRPKKLRNF